MALSKITNNGVAASGIPSGGIIQIQRTQLTSTFTTSLTGGANTSIDEFLVNITPTSTSSIIKLDASWFGEFGIDHDNVWNNMFFFFRDSTFLGAPSAGNRIAGINIANRSYNGSDDESTPESTYITYFDSPATTSQITYKLGIVVKTSDTLYTNRTVSDTDGNNHERGVSFISATEIAG